eukprot:ANDGO_04679.mRNA.1 hypothetical protein
MLESVVAIRRSSISALASEENHGARRSFAMNESSGDGKRAFSANLSALQAAAGCDPAKLPGFAASEITFTVDAQPASAVSTMQSAGARVPGAGAGTASRLRTVSALDALTLAPPKSQWVGGNEELRSRAREQALRNAPLAYGWNDACEESPEKEQAWVHKRKKRLYSPFKGKKHEERAARDSALLQRAKKRTKENSIVHKLEARLEYLRNNDTERRKLGELVERYKTERIMKRTGHLRSLSAVEVRSPPDGSHPKPDHAPPTATTIADPPTSFFLTGGGPFDESDGEDDGAGVGDRSANSRILEPSSASGDPVFKVVVRKRKTPAEPSDARILRVQTRKLEIDAEWMKRRLAIVDRAEHMEEIRKAAEERRAFQRTWLSHIVMLQRVHSLVHLMVRERVRKRFDRAARVIQRYWKGFTVFREIVLKEKALQLLTRFIIKVVARRRRVKARMSALLIRTYLEDIREANRILFVVKRFRHAVITVQRMWRRYRVSKRARMMILLSQFQKASAHICAKLTKQIKHCAAHDQLTAIVKRDEVQHLAPDIVFGLLEQNLRERQIVYLVQWRQYEALMNTYRDRVEFERARLLVQQQATPNAVAQIFPSAASVMGILAGRPLTRETARRHHAELKSIQAIADEQAVTARILRNVGPHPKPPHFATVIPPGQMLALVHAALNEQRERMKQRLIERGETIENIIQQDKDKHIDTDKDKDKQRDKDKDKEWRSSRERRLSSRQASQRSASTASRRNSSRS